MKTKSYLFPIIAMCFALFLGYIIYAANNHIDLIIFRWLKQIPYGDKIGHLFLIGTMALLLNLALKAKRISISRWKFLLGSIIMIVVVTLEEFSQIFISNRTFDLVDLSFNYIGILIGGMLASRILKS